MASFFIKSTQNVLAMNNTSIIRLKNNRSEAPLLKPLLSNQKRVFEYLKPFRLESGFVLPQFHLAYETFGSINEQRSNVVWVFHALTGDTNPLDWWKGLVGEDKLFDPCKHFIVCVNMPGSHYGSINPLSENPRAKTPYYHAFPTITTRDMANMYELLRLHLNIDYIHLGIGGSMGGMQLLEWSIQSPFLFKNMVVIASNAVHSPWGIAFNEAQRMAIDADSTWREKNANAGMKGMAAARAIALLSYRNYTPFLKTQSETDINRIEGFKVNEYQRYQGEKLTKRFNAFSYYSLSKSMDSHNVGRKRGSAISALRKIKANTLIVGIESDALFPIQEQEFLATHIPDAKFERIHSDYGHDGFLIEVVVLKKIIEKYFEV